MDFTIDNIEVQIEKLKGNVAAVARSFGKSRTAVYDKINGNKRLQKALVDSRQTMLDNVESKLYQKALDGDTTAMIFFLKTQGKSRGYTERQEITGANGGPVETVSFYIPDNDRNIDKND